MSQTRKAETLDQLHGFISAFPASPFRPQAQQLLHRLEVSAAQGGPS